jgi:hypothetical protein
MCVGSACILLALTKEGQARTLAAPSDLRVNRMAALRFPAPF